MHGPSVGSKLPTVGAARPIHVVMEMEETGSTVSGRIAIDGAPSRDFFGWLDLMDRLGTATTTSAVKPLAQDASGPERS